MTKTMRIFCWIGYGLVMAGLLYVALLMVVSVSAGMALMGGLVVGLVFNALIAVLVGLVLMQLAMGLFDFVEDVTNGN